MGWALPVADRGTVWCYQFLNLRQGHQSDLRQVDVDEAWRLFDTAERDGVALLPELLAVDLCVLGAALQSVFDEPVWRSWLALEDATRDGFVLDVLNGLAHRRLIDPPADVLACWLHPEGDRGVSGAAPRRLDLYRHREGQPLTREQMTVTAGADGDRIHHVAPDGVPRTPQQDLPALLTDLLIGGTRL